MSHLQQSKLNSLTQDIALIKHFSDPLSVLSDPRILDLLSLASTRPVTNADVRAILKLRRTGAWYCLDRLRKLTMLEKRGQGYRTSAYASDLIYAVSLTFRSILNGHMPKVDNSESFADAMRLASQGLEILYERGKIEQHDYDMKKRMLKELENTAARGGSRVG